MVCNKQDSYLLFNTYTLENSIPEINNPLDLTNPELERKRDHACFAQECYLKLVIS